MAHLGNVSIRRYEQTDFSTFFQIMRDAIRVTCAEAYGIETTTAWVADGNPSFQFNVPEHAFVMLSEGEIIAIAGWTLTDKVALHPVNEEIQGDPSHARINAVYVKPGYEGKGYGYQMVRYMELDIHRTTHVRNIYLWATLNAIPFYTRLGYTAGADQYPQVAPGFKVQVGYMWKTLE